MQAELSDQAVAADHERLHSTYEAHHITQQQLDTLFTRWEVLDRRWHHSSGDLPLRHC